MTSLALYKTCSLKPPRPYLSMMERVPEEYALHTEKFQSDSARNPRCGNTHVVITAVFLTLAQLFKLAYFGFLSFDVGKQLNHKAYLNGQLLEVSSLGFLYCAFLCELYYWAKTLNTVKCQALKWSDSTQFKRHKQCKESVIGVIGFTTLIFCFFNFACYKTHQTNAKDYNWTLLDELGADIFIDQSIASIIAGLYFFLLVGFLTTILKLLQILKTSYERRHNQFRKTIVSCKRWTTVAITSITIYVTFQATMRQMLNKWLKDFLYEANSTPLLFTWTLSIILTEFVAQLSLIVTLTKRYKIWFDRLNIFPLGLPDGAILPEQEILV